jgi:hypothetical protein
MIPGVCQFCSITDAQIDGDKVSWHNGARDCCSRYACVKRYQAQIKGARRAFQAQTRKKSPAEIHELQKQERRERNRRYREAAKSRGLIREKGSAA